MAKLLRYTVCNIIITICVELTAFLIFQTQMVQCHITVAMIHAFIWFLMIVLMLFSSIIGLLNFDRLQTNASKTISVIFLIGGMSNIVLYLYTISLHNEQCRPILMVIEFNFLWISSMVYVISPSIIRFHSFKCFVRAFVVCAVYFPCCGSSSVCGPIC